MCKVFVTEDVHLCDICIKAFFFAHMCVFLSLIEKHLLFSCFRIFLPD